jgi:branched-chain amino acid transport system ATP-binding protein
MLECQDLATFYGAAQILFDLSLQVEAGRSVCLVGRNGVGKSTCLRTIMGLTPARSGHVRYGGRDMTGLPAFRVAQAGIGYVPEDRRVFADLTVEDNLLIAQRPGPGINWNLSRSYEMFPALHEFRHRESGYLSGGQQQMLAIARSLMGCPSLLLLDEPTEGLAPVMVRALEAAILGLKREGLTMLLAAQDMQFATAVADDLYLISRGSVVYAGTVAEARRDAETLRVHLAI